MPLDYLAASKGLLDMSTFRKVAARTLIWLAAMTVPFQSLPASTCGCSSSMCCSQKDEQSGSCCSTEKARAGHDCCAARKAAPASSCCCQAGGGEDNACKCGANCQCGKTKRPAPVAPPTENNTTEKRVDDSVSTISLATACLARTVQRPDAEIMPQDADSALGRCVILSRFIL